VFDDRLGDPPDGPLRRHGGSTKFTPRDLNGGPVGQVEQEEPQLLVRCQGVGLARSNEGGVNLGEDMLEAGGPETEATVCERVYMRERERVRVYSVSRY
jgi:hypothetical protein